MIEIHDVGRKLTATVGAALLLDRLSDHPVKSALLPIALKDSLLVAQIAGMLGYPLLLSIPCHDLPFVAGTGLEPVTSGLWARRSTN